ncbi:protein of unknown function [Burkholderia multivorans]
MGSPPPGAVASGTSSTSREIQEILRTSVATHNYRHFTAHLPHFIFALRQIFMSNVYSIAAATRLTTTTTER